MRDGRVSCADCMAVASLLALAGGLSAWLVWSTLDYERATALAVQGAAMDTACPPPAPPPADEECWCAYARGDQVFVRGVKAPVRMPPAAIVVPKGASRGP